jgi:hypothetical protein
LEKGRNRIISNNIESLITNYLNNFENNTLYYWKNNGDFSNLHFTPISIELQEADGTSTEKVYAEKDYRIKFEFEIKELSYNVKIGFYFFTADGIALFGSYLTDYETTMPKKGMNIRYCTLPKNFLCVNKYILSLSVVLPNEWIINPYSYQSAIYIDVTHKADCHIPNGNIISPLVLWSCN